MACHDASMKGSRVRVGGGCYSRAGAFPARPAAPARYRPDYPQAFQQFEWIAEGIDRAWTKSDYVKCGGEIGSAEFPGSVAGSLAPRSYRQVAVALLAITLVFDRDFGCRLQYREKTEARPEIDSNLAQISLKLRTNLRSRVVLGLSHSAKFFHRN
jgi:hypothetical protein